MKLAIFSDIHGNKEALNSIIKDIKKRKVDDIICLGDVIGLGPSSDECLKMIYDNNIKYIIGNHELYYTKGIDKPHIKEKEILDHNKWVHRTINNPIDDSLLKIELNVNNKKLLFLHFFLKDDVYPYQSSHIFDTDEYKDIFKQYEFDYVFYGHRHEERIDEFEGKCYYGLDSSGCRKDDKTLYYLVDIDKDIKVKKVNLKYDRDGFINTYNNTSYPNKDHIGEYFFGIKKC